MKRYIKSSTASTDAERAEQWYSKVKYAVDNSGLSEMIEEYKEDTKIKYPCVYITLKEPYAVRYYSRWRTFLNYFLIAPNQADYVSPGSPDLVVTLSEKLSNNAAINKCKSLKDKIDEITARANNM